jgi:hypothetical protein
VAYRTHHNPEDNKKQIKMNSDVHNESIKVIVAVPTGITTLTCIHKKTIYRSRNGTKKKIPWSKK